MHRARLVGADPQRCPGNLGNRHRPRTEVAAGIQGIVTVPRRPPSDDVRRGRHRTGSAVYGSVTPAYSASRSAASAG